jgi:hypothetical protein
MGIVRFALKFPYTFYALAAFIVFLGALQAVEDKLLLKDEFVLRYDIENPSDGLPAGLFWRVASGSWTIASCRECVQKPARPSIACFPTAATSVCFPKRSIL